MKPFAPFLFFFLLCFCVAAQKALRPSDFLTTGTAYSSGNDCFQLTAPVIWQGGTVWYREPIDLQESFEMELKLFFGCDDEGADGMVFIFHPRLRDGFQGEGIGFGGLNPALGIEMDTYMNPHLADPEYDHLAVIKNGRMHHSLSISKAVPLLPGSKNIEDCKNHRINIKWNPANTNLRISIDGSLRLSTNYDIIGKIFRGNSRVYWGISSATGGKYNTHKVCMEKLEFAKSTVYDKNTAARIRSGEEYTLKGVDFLSGKTSLQQSSYDELDKLATLLKASPDHHIYIKGHTDDVGSASANQMISKKRADAVRDYLIQKGISKNRIKSAGLGESNPKFKNNSPENRLKNRRVDVMLIIPKA